jgi:hypothetical protein
VPPSPRSNSQRVQSADCRARYAGRNRHAHNGYYSVLDHAVVHASQQTDVGTGLRRALERLRCRAGAGTSNRTDRDNTGGRVREGPLKARWFAAGGRGQGQVQCRSATRGRSAR